MYLLVLVILWGVVLMGVFIVYVFGGQFDVVLVCKFGVLFNFELVVGLVEEGGWIYFVFYVSCIGVDIIYFEQESVEQMDVICWCCVFYILNCGLYDVEGCVVIVVDDGLVIGVFMKVVFYVICQCYL